MLLVFLTGFSPDIASAASVNGDWKVEGGLAHVRIADCAGSVWGAVAWEKTPGGKDVNNPDPSKRSRPMLGMVLLIDMKKEGAKDSWSGQIYNAENGKLYKATIKPGARPDELDLQGCLMGFLCGGQTWTRVNPPRSPSAILDAPKNQGAKSSAASTSSKVSPAPVSPSKTLSSGQKGPAVLTVPAGDIGDVCMLPETQRSNSNK
jgi:uncharacterized protein (DUF2147 family)